MTEKKDNVVALKDDAVRLMADVTTGKAIAFAIVAIYPDGRKNVFSEIADTRSGAQLVDALHELRGATVDRIRSDARAARKNTKE